MTFMGSRGYGWFGGRAGGYVAVAWTDVRRDEVLALVEQGRDYREVAGLLGIPAGRAYLIATGIPADGSDAVTGAQRRRPGMLPSRSQHLVNPREVNPTAREDVREWMRWRARTDAQMQDAARRTREA